MYIYKLEILSCQSYLKHLLFLNLIKPLEDVIYSTGFSTMERKVLMGLCAAVSFVGVFGFVHHIPLG